MKQTIFYRNFDVNIDDTLWACYIHKSLQRVDKISD